MKFKLAILTFAAMLGGVMSSGAATMLIQNVSNGPGDTLWALNDNSLMNSGTVTMGYFAAGVTLDQINTIEGLVANLGQFTAVTTVAPGAAGATLGVGSPGYAEGADTNGVAVPGGLILAGNTLLGRTVFQIVTDASGLASATTSNQFALMSFGTFLGDQPIEQSFNGNPDVGTVIISGGTGSYIADGNFAAGEGTYNTLKLAVVPEPSSALLGAVGALALLRRRRN